MPYDVHIAQWEARPLAVVRRRAAQHELAKVVPQTCGEVWKAVRARNIPGVGRHVAVYLDSQIHLEVGVELESPFAGDGEIVGSSTPSGLVATTTHYGPYGLLAVAHNAILKWCASHGHLPAGPSWEIYGHWRAEWNHTPSAITTDVFYLLRIPG